MNLKTKMTKLAKEAHVSSRFLATLPTAKKNKILKDMSKMMLKSTDRILRENKKDLKNAQTKGLPNAMLDRLALSEVRIAAMARSILDVAKLKDPVGVKLKEWKRPNGLKIAKVSVPLGVVLVIYESRPNVTVECASLALKSGNSIILKGGSEAFHSNKILVEIFKDVLKKHAIPSGVVSFVATTERKAVDELLELTEYISVVVPRGGEGLIRTVVAKSKIPVIKHYKGICHVYVDQDADVLMAESIVINAKVQRPGVCNALETLLVHSKIARSFLPQCAKSLQERGVEVRGCDKTKALLPYYKIKKTTIKDYETEYLDLILAIRVVRSIEEAIDHINTYGSGHTDAIVTAKKKAAQQFVEKVDSSSVMVNASTRFSDGNEYGLGAEIGISTDKIHARGPMGLEGLTSYKYVVCGTGQIRT
jgi:glutamate-5-semialdehyde dehydrogenase